MRVVVDCNVLIGAGWNPGVCRATIEEVILNHTCLTSPDIIKEYLRVINYAKFNHIKKTLHILCQKFLDIAILVEPSSSPNKLPDSSDEVYLATALSAGADVIITGNKKHFTAESCGKIKVLTPAEFLEML